MLCLWSWPGLAWIEPEKPAILATVFVFLSWRLRVDSWPLTIAFSLSFFIYGAVAMLASSYNPSNDLAHEPLGTKSVFVYFGIMILSPISLWAPVILGSSSYAMIRRLRPNARRSGP